MLLSVCINSDDYAKEEELEKIHLAAKLIYNHADSPWNLDIRMNGNTLSLKRGILKYGYNRNRNYIGYTLESFNPELLDLISKKDRTPTLTFSRPRRQKTAVFFGYVDVQGEFRGEGTEVFYSWPKPKPVPGILQLEGWEELSSHRHQQSH